MKAGRAPDSTIDINDRRARNTHDVVVIVQGSTLVARRGTPQLDPANDTGAYEVAKNVVHRLHGGAVSVTVQRAVKA